MKKRYSFIVLLCIAAVSLAGCGNSRTGTATADLADGGERGGFDEATRVARTQRDPWVQTLGASAQTRGGSRMAEDIPKLIATVIRTFATGSARGGEGSVSGMRGAGFSATASSNAGLKVPVFDQNNVGAAKPGAYCGPTSVKMVLDYFGVKKDVNECAKGVYVNGAGASHGGMLTKLQQEGLAGSYLTYGKSLSWLKSQTDGGKPVIVNVKGDYGPRSTNGHVVVVTGVTDDGEVIINDPAGGKQHTVDGGTFNGAWHRASGSGLGIVCSA